MEARNPNSGFGQATKHRVQSEQSACQLFCHQDTSGPVAGGAHYMRHWEHFDLDLRLYGLGALPAVICNSPIAHRPRFSELQTTYTLLQFVKEAWRPRRAPLCIEQARTRAPFIRAPLPLSLDARCVGASRLPGAPIETPPFLFAKALQLCCIVSPLGR